MRVSRADSIQFLRRVNLADLEIRWRATDPAIRITDRLAKLYRLDAPQPIQADADDVNLVDRRELAARQLLELSEKLNQGL